MKLRTAALAVASSAVLVTGLGVSSASAAPAKPDTACMRAGMQTLKDLGLFSTVAKSGLPLSLAVSAGVTPRPGTDVSALPAVLPLSVVLADHRAGDNSLFIYPWCS